jgi:hypothetical protein
MTWPQRSKWEYVAATVAAAGFAASAIELLSSNVWSAHFHLALTLATTGAIAFLALCSFQRKRKPPPARL